ncbi:MAG: SdrD B-like domain-containing protein [Chloroflexota bacterium]
MKNKLDEQKNKDSKVLSTVWWRCLGISICLVAVLPIQFTLSLWIHDVATSVISTPLKQAAIELTDMLPLPSVAKAMPNTMPPSVKIAAPVAEISAAAVFAPELQQASTPNTEIVLSVSTDGTEPFATDAAFAGHVDGQHTPGLDDNANNNVVRTFDSIQYRIDYNVNEVDATNVVISAVLPDTVGGLSVPGLQWIVDPDYPMTAGCDRTTSTISGDGKTLTCVIGDLRQGSAGTIFPIAELNDAVTGIDGEVINLTATIDTDQTTPVTSNQVSTTISASPGVDWVKGIPTMYEDVTRNATGNVGRVFVWPIYLATDSGHKRGSEPLGPTVDITLYDHLYYLSTNSNRLAATLITTADVGDYSNYPAARGCGGYDGTGNVTALLDGTTASRVALPYGVNGLGDATNTTTGAFNGTEAITCVEDAATTPNNYPTIRIDISGYDLSAAPALAANNAKNNSGALIAAQVAFWLSETELLNGGATNGYLHNAIAGTTTAIAAPSPVDQVSTVSSAIDVDTLTESTTINNLSLTQFYEDVNVGGPSGYLRGYSHFVRFDPGPYQERVAITAQDESLGLEQRGFDHRAESVGGLGYNGVNATGAWTHDGTVSRNQLVTLALGVRASSGKDIDLLHAVHGCLYVDNTYLDIVDFPTSFTVNRVDARAINLPTKSGTTGSASDGLAHVIGGIGFRYMGFRHPNQGADVILVDKNFPDYVVEVATAAAGVGTDYDRGQVRCDNSHADVKGWVATTDTANLAQFDADNDGRYEGIEMVRLRMHEAGNWRYAGIDTQSTFDQYGLSFNLYLQARVKDTILEAPNASQIFIHGARARGDWDGTTAPTSHECISNFVTDGNRQANFPDSASGNFLTPDAGWCNLATVPNGVEVDPIEQSAGGSNKNWFVHRDTIAVTGPSLHLEKHNTGGLNDIVDVGDLVTFTVGVSVTGAPVFDDQLNNITITDTLPAYYEFVRFNHVPVTAGTSCSESNNEINCSLDTRMDPWGDSFGFTVRVVRTESTTANAPLPNEAIATATSNGGELYSASSIAFAYMPAAYHALEVRKNVPDLNGDCLVAPGAPSAGILPQGDCSVIDLNGLMIFTLDITNTGIVNLDDLVLIDVLPHLADENEAQTSFSGTPASSGDLGDGRTPESNFNGTTTLLNATGAVTLTYTNADPATVSRDPDNTVASWAASVGQATAVRAAFTQTRPSDTHQVMLTIDTDGNVQNDLYSNTFGGRTPDILLPVRSNDVSVMPLTFVQIGNLVWIEDDNDGDATTGITTTVSSATVTATASDGTPYTDITDSNGNYSITVPANVVYTVTVATPVGTTPAGTLITSDNDPNAQNNLSHDGSGTVVTVGTVDNLTIDFGFYDSPLVTSIAVEKILNTPDPVFPGATVTFTIRITNTGTATITTLPLTDTYNTTYLTYVGVRTTPESDSNANSGQIVWSDLTQAAPNGFGQNFAPDDVWDVGVEFTARFDTTELPNNWTVNTAQVFTHTITDTVRIYNPTNVVLSNRDVTVEEVNGNNMVVLLWSTADETEAVGFHILRIEPDAPVGEEPVGAELVGAEPVGAEPVGAELIDTEPVRLTNDEQLIVAKHAGTANGGDYRYEDTTAEPGVHYHYILEIVTAGGTRIPMDMGTVDGGPPLWTVYLPMLRR